VGDKDDILCALDEAEVTQGVYLVGLDTGLMIEGKGVEGPVPREPGLFDSIQEAAFLPMAMFFVQQTANHLSR